MPIIHNLTDSILDIEIRRPEKRNTLDGEMLESLAELFRSAQSDSTVRVVFLHAQPGIFSAGEDLAEEVGAAAGRMMAALSSCTKPVVACVQGPAVGLAVAMLYACDLVYASESSLFSLPYTALGLTPRFGLTLLAGQNAGYRKAAQKMLLSEPISANEAFAMNLVNGVFPDEKVLEQAAARATRLASLSPVAVQQTKTLLRGALYGALEAVQEAEEAACGKAAASAYAKEAKAAFLAGRKPDFSNIEDATWFLSDYQHDVSVMSMVNALQVWDRVWSKSQLDAGIAYEYLTRHVTFWLFVMNETVQGERLYITMNGRGKNLSEDEIIRAKVFRDAVSTGHAATDVGMLFESMTDFFWTHRVKDELTADKGMKKFFRWVYLLERYEAERNVQGMPYFAEALRNDGKDGKWFELDESMFGHDEETGLKRITFELIELTFNSLEILYGSDSSAQIYLRPSMLEDDDRSGAFQQDCFVLLPLLHWLHISNETD